MSTKIETALTHLKNDVTGFLSANLTDAASGMSMGYIGSGDAEVDAVVGSEFYKAIEFGIDTLKLDDCVDDNLLTLGKSLHIVRPLDVQKRIFIHLALDKRQANLAMARHSLRKFVQELSGQI